MTKNIGMILLALFLILYGITALTNLQVVALNVIQGCLATGAGILILVGK